MPKESLVAARSRAIRRVKEALRPPSTLALVADLSGTIEVPNRPNYLYARLITQLSKVIIAEIGAAPPYELTLLRNWTIEVKELPGPGVRYRVINWLRDALGRPISLATYNPARHELDPTTGPHVGSLDDYYYTETELSGSGGAALIGIEDAGGFYEGVTVEAALQELLGSAGVKAYRHIFSNSKDFIFSHPFSQRPAVTVHFDTTIGFGIQAFGTSQFGGKDYWTQEGPLAPNIVSITFPPSKIRVKLSALATGEVLCHV